MVNSFYHFAGTPVCNKTFESIFNREKRQFDSGSGYKDKYTMKKYECIKKENEKKDV